MLTIQHDPNLPDGLLHKVEDIEKGKISSKEKEILEEILDESPYPEVQAAVSNVDDPSLPVNTIRMWVIGLTFTILGSGMNMLFSMRSPSITLTSLIAQLIAFPVGKIWARCLPSRVFNTFGIRWSLNPCPFNLKEHVVITIMANVSFGGGAAYATDILLAQRAFYGQHFGAAFDLLLVISTQVLGYSLAGISRRFLVWPAAVIWPSVLVNTTLFQTLHTNLNHVADGWKITRYRFFLYVSIGGFFWYFFPGYIFTGLSTLAFVTWIAPKNVVINELFGATHGLDFIPLTLDWTQVTGFVLSPLPTPWWAEANILASLIFWIWLVSPILHYTNVWQGRYMPISSSRSYDNTGVSRTIKPRLIDEHIYNVSQILTKEFTLDIEKYKTYSPIFLPTTFALGYGLSFASMTSVLVYVYLNYRHEIVEQFKKARNFERDIHMKLMEQYPDTPDWWYWTIGVTMFAISIIVCHAWDTHFPWWAFLICELLPLVFFVPIGLVQGITNTQIGLNVLTEFICGYMLPGRPLANVMFKCYGYMTMNQGLSFVQDLKMGHYMKIPPRTLFWTQTIATIVGAIVQVGVLDWSLANISGVCTNDATNNFNCPGATVFFNASIIWGVVGPKRLFSYGQIYYSQLWFFLLGALLPIPVYFLQKRYPNRWFKYVNTPLFFGGIGMIPPATAINYVSWAAVGFIFNYLIRHKYFQWWSKYNYILSAALDCSLALSTIFLFFCFDMTQINFPSWWGNTVAANTADANGTPLDKVPPGGHFGPSSW
ncbi:Sexual differentiation process protein isp4 [Neolecta irregularis DAH-3]|uniref:Sexual differentiation process protein isp4 n=1 Tax=Neolecta irregularis (strain DAH-3) TaxID=1198029 RepID=A0A1U7LQ88_NEOID|nr:Sexual differentiation process protein isp4 [Neolecta irregularis DAH-3]|eukprot:OLL24788.1 Sexual differentiation process protein isp4 [Neolecta irregularis DAH-3]